MIALLAATDAPWAALQSVAWANMIISYSQKAPFKVALMHTFDGKHPCRLCKAIAAARKSEKKKEFPLQVRKLEFPPAPENFVPVAPLDFRLMPLENSFADFFNQKPPLQPPRSFFV